jgi:hypothetical protein
MAKMTHAGTKRKSKMKKVLLIATVMAFASTGFASSAFAVGCDPVKNPKACKSVVHVHKVKAKVKKKKK